MAARSRPPLPFMPLYVGALEADTANLTDAQFGAYVRILICMWASGGWVPGDDASLCRIARSDPRNWRRRIGPAVRPFLIEGSDGRLTQARLQRELAQAQSRTAARIVAADARWRPDQPRLFSGPAAPRRH